MGIPVTKQQKRKKKKNMVSHHTCTSAVTEIRRCNQRRNKIRRKNNLECSYELFCWLSMCQYHQKGFQDFIYCLKGNSWRVSDPLKPDALQYLNDPFVMWGRGGVSPFQRNQPPGKLDTKCNYLTFSNIAANNWDNSECRRIVQIVGRQLFTTITLVSSMII